MPYKCRNIENPPLVQSKNPCKSFKDYIHLIKKKCSSFFNIGHCEELRLQLIGHRKLLFTVLCYFVCCPFRQIELISGLLISVDVLLNHIT
jgi:hypothetical protein